MESSESAAFYFTMAFYFTVAFCCTIRYSPFARATAIPTLSYLEIGYCGVVIVASYALRGSTGFGGAVAMPLLALIVPLKILVPVWTLLGIASSATIVARDYRSIAVYDLLRTLPAGLIGIAIGLYVFTALDAGTLARGLGLLVIAYGFYALWTTRPAAGRQSAAGPQSSTRTPLSQRLLAPVAG